MFKESVNPHSTLCAHHPCQVTGLKGLTYLDKSKDPKNPAQTKDDRDAIMFGDALVDSVYLGAPAHVELDVGTGETGCLRALEGLKFRLRV